MPDENQAGDHTTVELRRASPDPTGGESPTTVLAAITPPPVEHPTAVLDLPSALPAPPSPVAPSAPAPSPAPALAAAPPGWYADPWSPGLRYYDGTQWTDNASSAGSGDPGIAYAVARPRLGVPGWAFGLWWVVMMAAAVAVFFFVLLAAGFACDSGWEGCAQAASDAVATYVVVTLLLATLVPLLAVVIARGRTLGRFLRIVALIVMTLAPILGVVAAATLLGSRAPG